MAENRRRVRKNRAGNRSSAGRPNALVIFLLSFLGVLILAYLITAVYFTKHFLFNTYVNGIPAYNKTAKQIEDEVVSGLKQYVMTIHGRGDVTDTISSEDIQLSLQMDDQFEDALKSQNPFLWPGYLFHNTDMTTENIVVYSRETVESRINQLSFFSDENVIAPVDAHLSDTVGDQGFYIVPEEYGQKPIKQSFMDEICAALDVLEEEITISDSCYESPEVFSTNEELNSLCNNLNQYCSASIVYEFGDETVTVDGVMIKEWCNINGTEVTLDNEKVREFVNSIAKAHDTFGKNRTIVSHSGETVEITGGDYGWWMDRATETSELIEQIKVGAKGVRTPVYFGTAAVYGDKDWGDSYVEIDLTAQHLWVYSEGSVVVESDFVSGCVNKGRTTPRGSYAITYKERDATLVGENYSSAVQYWRPFNGNVGMHDASWRSEFGGDIYVTNGSHGCINLPTAKAAAIYDVVSKGEAVFVYGGKTEPEPTVPEGYTVGPDGTLIPVNPDGTTTEGATNPDGTPVDGAATDPAQTTEAAPADGAATPADGAATPATTETTETTETPSAEAAATPEAAAAEAAPAEATPAQ